MVLESRRFRAVTAYRAIGPGPVEFLEQLSRGGQAVVTVDGGLHAGGGGQRGVDLRLDLGYRAGCRFAGRLRCERCCCFAGGRQLLL